MPVVTTFVEYGRDDRANLFASLHNWKFYPKNLGSKLEPRNRPMLIEQIQCYFEKTKHNSLFTLDESWGAARRRAIERKIRTVWFDWDPERPHFNHAPSIIRDSRELEEFLGIKELYSEPVPDPTFRLIILESSRPGSPRLKVTEELLLKILTYYKVTPYFLDYITHICHEPTTGIIEAPIGGFRYLKSSPSSGFSNPVNPPDISSALQYQLVFEFKTVINPFGDADADSILSADNDGLCFWPIMQSAIYHRFDPSTGKSLWILTPPSASTGPNWPWNRAINSEELLTQLGADPSGSSYPPASTIRPTIKWSFSTSLSIMTWLADWSLSQYDAYIATLDEQMKLHSLPYIDAVTAGLISELTLKIYNQYVEQVEQCLAALESNRSTLSSIVEFYSSSSSYPDLLRSLPNYNNFRADMASVLASYDDLILRANTVRCMAARRERVADRLLQHRNATTTAQLRELTHLFSKMALLLLAVLVVSAVFSTDIVKFSTRDRANERGYAGDWSGPAGVWWLGSTLVATALVGGLGELWRRRRNGEEAVGHYVFWGEKEEGGDDGGEKRGTAAVVRWVRRTYGDTESRIRARAQWVKGNVRLVLFRWRMGGRRGSGGVLGEGMEADASRWAEGAVEAGVNDKGASAAWGAEEGGSGGRGQGGEWAVEGKSQGEEVGGSSSMGNAAVWKRGRPDKGKSAMV